MKIEINFAFCALVVLTGSSQTKGQNSPTTTTLTAVDLSSEAGASASSVPPTDAAELQEHDSDDPSYQTSSEYQDGTTAISIVITSSHVIGQSQTDTADRNGTTTTTRMSTAAHTDDTVKTTPSVFSLSDSPASASMPPDVETSTPLQYISTPPNVETSTPLQYMSTPDSSNKPAGTGLHTTSAPPSLIPPPLDVATLQPSTHASTEAPPTHTNTHPPTTSQPHASTEAPPTQTNTHPPTTSQPYASTEAPPTQTNTHPPTTSQPQASAPAYPPDSQPRQEVPSELNVGDEDFKGPRHRHSSPLDPLLAGLVSVFIVTTAIISVVLFLKFRQRTDHPEFHRLQDLPMDDLLEDTPLSRYSY